MNKSGFIIVELLISIVIFATIMLLFNSLLVGFEHELNINENINYDVELLYKLQADLKTCKEITAEYPFTCQQYNDQELKYEIKDEKLIRTIDNQGYEIVHPDIQAFKVEENEGIYVLINNHTYPLGAYYE